MSVRTRSSGKPLLATTAGREMAPGLAAHASTRGRRQPISLRQALAGARVAGEPLPLIAANSDEAPARPSTEGLPRWVDAARRERGRSRLSAAKGWLATIAVTGLIIGTAVHFLAAQPAATARVTAPAN